MQERCVGVWWLYVKRHGGRGKWGDNFSVMMRRRWRQGVWGEYGMLLGIVGLAAVLRLVRVATVPGWYTDEGTHLEIVRHLLVGERRYLALTESTLLVARLPLFEWVLAFWVRLFGLDMGTLRGLTAVLNMVAVLLLYVVVRGRGENGRVLPLLAAFLLAIYPQAIVYSRFGFSYNLLSVLLLLALWGLQRNDRMGLGVAAVAVGLAMVSDLWGLMLLPALLLAVVGQRWRAGWWVLLLALGPLGVYVVVHWLTVPAAFWFDVEFALFRANPHSFWVQWQTLRDNVVMMVGQDGWWLLAGWGWCCCLRPLAQRRTLLLFVLFPLLLLGRVVALHGLSAYYLIPLLPLVAWGVAVLLWQAAVWLGGARWPLVLGVLLLPFMVAVGQLGWGVVNGRLATPIDLFLLEAETAERVAAWLVERVQADEVVLASPTVAWALPGQVADFQMMVAVEGVATPHFPADIPPSRFAFVPRYEAACWLVVDDLWRRWAAVHVPGVAEVLAAVAGEGVYEVGEVVVYRLEDGCEGG